MRISGRSEKRTCLWKREANYHWRSLAETGVCRFKTIFSDKLQSRKQDNQFQEIIIKCAALNRMTHLKMLDSGHFVERTQPKVRMRCGKKGARLSLVSIGTLFWREVTGKLKLTTKLIKENLPVSKVRFFPWLQVQLK